MANYGVYGRIKISGDCEADTSEAKVYPYFCKVDSDSPDSKWSDESYPVDDDNYYTFDVSDNAILGSEASWARGKDKVYIAVVMGGSGELDSLDCTHVTFHQHTTVNEDDIEINLNLHPKRAPIIDTYTFPDAILTVHEYTMDEESYADTSWVNDGCYDVDVTQKLVYDLVDIFDGHQLIDTVYAWGEIDEREVDNNSEDKFTYTYAGDYTLAIRVREKWNTFTEVTKDVRVKYNEPEIDFHWSPIETNDWDGSKIKGQEEITFHNDSTDLDNRTSDEDFWGDEVYTYKWEIEDANQDDSDNTETVEGAKHPDEPTHKFQREGTYDITLTMYWNDGFDDYEKSITKQISIYPFTIVPEFHWSEEVHNRGQAIEFDPFDTTGDTGQISQYDWVIDDNYAGPDTDAGLYTFDSAETSVFDEGSSDNTQSVDNTYDIVDVEKPVVHFHSVIDKDAALTMTYSDGWKDVTNGITHVVGCAKYDIVISFEIDDVDPQGRWIDVTATNTSAEYTQDEVDIGYTIDWELTDYYSECNLDNPEPGEVTDNSDTAMDVAKDETIVHAWQNTDENEVKLRIRYDDGYQMQTKELVHTVTPIVFIDPVPDISWTPETPQGRDIEVTVSNVTDYDNDRCRDVDWVLHDKYSACNLDNENPGEETDNTVTLDRKAYDYEPLHKWQNVESNDIDMTYWFDDGYCERSVSKTEVITPIVFADPDPLFSWTPEVPQGRTVDVTITNDTDCPVERSRDIDWTISDKYSTCNLDNPEPGEETDNSELLERKAHDYQPVHAWQNVEGNNIKMDYYWDDGYCERLVTKEDTITPIVFPDPDPTFTWDPEVPKGRDVTVTVTNTTDYDTSRCMDLDWRLEDYYSTCNLDNPEAGEETDNTATWERQAHDFEPTHEFQSPVEHDMWMKYWFDDGYCERSVELTQQITPIVYDGLIADFSWDVVPGDRDTEVTFSNESTDDDNRFRSYSWIINDHYNKWNPDSSDYGVGIVDNTQTIVENTDQTLQPVHKFQDNTDELVEFTYLYDDGYCEREVADSDTVIKTVYTITPVIANDKETLGKMEIIYTNDGTGDIARELDEKWDWNDIVFSTDDDEWTLRDDQAVRAEQPFTWQTPSRKPYCVMDGATADNVNKLVQLEVRIDTGWRDDTDDGTVGTDNDSGDGGQVYWPTEELYEATPYEISSELTYECNVEGYTHD